MKKTLFVLSGYCVGLGGLLLVTYRTLLALGTESKSITISVNRFGEQYVDLACLVFLWSVCVIGLLSLSSVLKKERVGVKFGGEGNGELFLKKPGVPFDVVSVSLLNDPSKVVVGEFGALFNEIDQRYFLLDDEGTGSAVSVSVTVLQDAFKE